MSSNLFESFQEFCRICLGKCKMKSSDNSIVKETLSIEALKVVTGIDLNIKIIEQSICPVCCSRINALYSFREQALSSTDICQTLIASEEDTLAELKLFCRLCLLIPQSESLKYRYGDVEEYRELCTLIFECTNLKLKPIKDEEGDDEKINDARYPDIICEKCHIKLRSFKHIRYQAKQSEGNFENVLKPNRSKINDQFVEQQTKEVTKLNDYSMSKIDSQIKVECTDSEKYSNSENEFSIAPIKFENFNEDKVVNDQLQIKIENEDEFINSSLSEEIKNHAMYLEGDKNNDIEFNAENDIKIEDNIQPMDIRNTYFKEIKTEAYHEIEDPLESLESNNQNEFPQYEINEELDENINTRQLIKVENHIEYSADKIEINEYEIISDNNRSQIENYTQIEQYPSEIPNSEDSNLYLCTQCDSSFSSESKFREHIYRIHSEKQNELFRCNFCKKTFSNYYNIQVHINNIHLKTTPKCEFCHKWFSSESSLKEHKTKDHSRKEDKLFQCQYCELSFSCKKQLKNHTGNVHSMKRGRKFKCRHCEKIFCTKLNLVSHLINIHSETSKENLFKCKFCPEYFLTSSKLKAHTKSMHITKK